MNVQSGRSLARLNELKVQYSGGCRTLVTTTHVARVPFLNALLPFSTKNGHNDFTRPSLTSSLIRLYATRPVSRPKQHTGRTVSKRKTPTTSATKAAKVPRPPKTTPKALPSSKSTTKPKPKPKSKSKSKPKKKAKAKPKKKALTEEQKARKAEKAKTQKIKELKEIALTPPSSGATSAWVVFNVENTKGKAIGPGQLAQSTTDLSAKFRRLEPEQLEKYNHIANQNKTKAAQAYREFIESHTPLEIYEANNARHQLQRLLSASGKKRTTKWTPLRDERQVKRPTSSFFQFSKARQATQDYKGMTISTKAGLIGREWKALPAEEKKEFEDRGAADKERYRQELKTVLGREVGSPRSKKTTAT